jgi:branched-chain amino acid transport system substrate-binding protein
MLMSRLPRFAALAAALAIGAGADAFANEPGVSADSIRIGTFGALTGPGYLYGKLPMNGVEVVFDEVNAAGGIHGRKLQLVREDDRCDAASAIAAIQKLVHQDQVFCLDRRRLQQRHLCRPRGDRDRENPDPDFRLRA